MAKGRRMTASAASRTVRSSENVAIFASDFPDFPKRVRTAEQVHVDMLGCLFDEAKEGDAPCSILDAATSSDGDGRLTTNKGHVQIKVHEVFESEALGDEYKGERLLQLFDDSSVVDDDIAHCEPFTISSAHTHTHTHTHI